MGCKYDIEGIKGHAHEILILTVYVQSHCLSNHTQLLNGVGYLDFCLTVSMTRPRGYKT